MRTPKEIAAELFATKSEEDRMKARRTALELEFAAAIGVSDQWEGSKTNDFDEYKVTVSRKMNDKIDVASFTLAWIETIYIRQREQAQKSPASRWRGLKHTWPHSPLHL